MTNTNTKSLQEDSEIKKYDLCANIDVERGTTNIKNLSKYEATIDHINQNNETNIAEENEENLKGDKFQSSDIETDKTLGHQNDVKNIAINLPIMVNQRYTENRIVGGKLILFILPQ